MPLRMYDCTRSYCFRFAIGPTAVFGSVGSPTGKAGMVSTIARLTSSKRLFGTRSLVPATQDLTVVQKPDDERIGDGLLEVGIIKQNVGRLATQLKRDALHRRSTVTHDRSSDSGRARKGNLGHVGISYKLGSDDIPSSGDNVAKPFRKFRLVYTLEPNVRLQSAQLTRLHDHRATGGDCRGKFHTKEKRVRVPRGNQTGNTDRLHGDRCFAPTPSQRQFAECLLSREEHVGARL